MISDVHRAMADINRAWRELRPYEMETLVHPDITMVLPGFSGTIIGRDPFVQSFVDFCRNATVLEYTESDEQIQVIGSVAIVTYRFDMLYEQPSYRARSTGRDMWIFNLIDDTWFAVWRTMIDIEDTIITE